MRSTEINLSIFLVFSMSISACGLQGSAQKKQEAPESQRQEAQETQKKEWVDYEPAVVEFKGKLVAKTFFGPPNYGESPKTDSKEKEWILSLEKPINVRGRSGPDAGFESASVEDTQELQLVLSVPHNELIGKKVIVKGTLFHAQTGHHLTEVLLDVQSISLSASDQLP